MAWGVTASECIIASILVSKRKTANEWDRENNSSQHRMMTLTRISVREVRSRSWKDGDVADDDYSTVTIHNSNNKFSSISRIFLRTSENLKWDCRPSSTDGHTLAKICSNPKTTKNVPRMSVNWSEIDPDGRRCGEYSLAIHSSMPVNHLRYHWC